MASAVRKSKMKQVPLSEVKDDLSRFLREAETQDVVITRHGKPAVCSLDSSPKMTGSSTGWRTTHGFWSVSRRRGQAFAPAAASSSRT